MGQDPTLWELVSAERVAIERVVTAVDAYLADPGAGSLPLGGGLTLDPAAAVAAHAPSRAVLEGADAGETARRIAVRTALLMARPSRR